MNKRLWYKFIFLMIVALLIVGTYIWKWTTDEPKRQKPEDLFDESQQQEKAPPKLNEQQIDETLKDGRASASNDKTNDTFVQDNQQNEKNNNHESTYKNKFGEQAFTHAKEQAKQGLALYLSQVSDWDKWQGTVTHSFLTSIKQDILTVNEGNVDRSITSIDLFAFDASTQDNMVFGAFATWHVTSNGRATTKRTQLYYVTVVQQNDSWLVNKIVTPNEGMEGKKAT